METPQPIHPSCAIADGSSGLRGAESPVTSAVERRYEFQELLERLQRAEQEKAQAQARVVQERRRRRITVALALVVLGLVLSAGIAWRWIERDRQARLDLALSKVIELGIQAEKKVNDDPTKAGATLVLWRQALATLEQELDAGQVDKENSRVWQLASWQHYAFVHVRLAAALSKKGDLDGAIHAYQEALRLDKDSPNPFYQAHVVHFRLGVALQKKSDLVEAIQAFRAALRLKNDFTLAHYNLGKALAARGDFDGAIKEYQEALRLNKGFSPAHSNLGLALQSNGDLVGAVLAYRKALAIDPKSAPAHSNLGLALRRQGKFEESLAAFRRWQKRASQDPKSKEAATREVARAEQLIQLGAKLPGFLKGSEKPADADQALLLRELCSIKDLHAAAVRFARSAFDAQSRLADDLEAGHRYGAACSAVLAGCGQDKDANDLDAQERGRLRRQALDWLRADLKLRHDQFATGKLEERAKVLRAIANWRRDRDLAGVRDTEALAKLPEAERKAWQQFWAEVEALYKMASASRSL
jgi:tetratricopeptide (TPR) repeat protein